MKRKSAWQGKAEELAEELAKRSTPEESRLVVNSLRDELAGPVHVIDTARPPGIQ